MAAESEIQAAIKEYLQWTGWFVFKNHQSLGSHRGVADLVAMKDGLTVWIEVKTPIVARSVDDVEMGINPEARLSGGG